MNPLYLKAKDRPADWFEKHDFRLSTERIKELVERAKTKLIFLCGIPSNDNEFREYYDKIICLVIDEGTMRQRVAERTTNNFGKSPDELALMLYWHGKMLERYKEWEGSWTRKIIIMVLTYAVVVTYLFVIGNNSPWINAIVPPVGFLLSTLAVGRLRIWWQSRLT